MVVAAVPLVLVGFLALIWLVATEPIWWPALENASAALGPVVGAAVRSLLGNIRAGINALGGWLDHQAAPAVQLTWGIYWLAYQRVTGVPGALNQAWQAINRVQTVTVPHAVGLEGAARTTADDNLWKSTVGLAEQTQAKAQALVDGESTQRQLQDARLEQLLNIDVQGAKDQATAQISSEANTRTLSDDALGRSISAQGDQLTQLIDSGLAATGAAAAAQLLQEVTRASGAEATLEEDLTQIRNSRCMKVCDILGGIGEALQGLELAGLLALLAEAYSNPEGAAATIRSDLVQPAEQAWGDVLGLFGIKAA